MKEIVYNKLVRDKIPEIIEADGKICKIEILSDAKYLEMIDAKLDEELAEYHKDQNLEELADLLEVIHAAAIARGYSIEELEAFFRSINIKTKDGYKHYVLFTVLYETGTRVTLGMSINKDAFNCQFLAEQSIFVAGY